MKWPGMIALGNTCRSSSALHRECCLDAALTSPRDRLPFPVGLKQPRWRGVVAAPPSYCWAEQAKRCLRSHPYLDPPHLRLRNAEICPSAALRTLAARTAAHEDDCDTRQQREPSHPAERLAPLGQGSFRNTGPGRELHPYPSV